MRYSRIGLTILLTLTAVSTAAAQGRAPAQGRFAGMDQNNDGRITKAEWRGSERSFANHDWNGDGVLSGDEVRPGARRADRTADDWVFDSPDREYEYDDWTPRGFTALDHDGNGRITANEWHFDREGFRRADHNRDNALSRAEFLNEASLDDDRDDRFRDLDRDGDDRISTVEWHGSEQRFEALDANNDHVLTRAEMLGSEPPSDLFTSLDMNRDSTLSRTEWHWSRASFDQRDTNRDGKLTKAEFGGGVNPQQQNRSNAYRMGYARGLTEGRQAGMEDGPRKRWDLEGQRELEQADSGYEAQFGPREEYQAGYRDAFRSAYRQAYGSQ